MSIAVIEVFATHEAVLFTRPEIYEVCLHQRKVTQLFGAAVCN